MSELANKIVVVTGASAGVGRATTVEFARQGATVALLARGKAGLEGARAEEYHPDHGLLGNFPQALSHLALVKTAYLLQACEQAHHGGQPERHSYRPVD